MVTKNIKVGGGIMSMEKKFFKMMSLLLAVALFTSLFVGCGSKTTQEPSEQTGSKTETNEPAESKDSEGETTEESTDDLALEDYPDVMQVTAYLAGGCNPPQSDDNLTKQYILENLKIDLSGCTWPAGEDSLQKINTMAVSGELPDVVQYWARPEVFNQMADAGLLLPLDDYLKYLPNYLKNAAQEVVDFYRNPKDGKLYVLPSFTVSTDDPDAALKAGNNRCLMLRTDIWEKYGKMPLNTPEDLYNFLKVVKENEKDMIPFGSVPHFLWELLNFMFIPEYGPYYVKIDDSAQRIYSTYYLPGYLDGLKYFAKLYREGLMDPELLMLSQDQTEEKMNNAKYVVYMGYNGTVSGLGPKLEQQGIGKLEAIQFPFNEGVEASKRLLYEPLGWSMVGISKNTKDPVRLLKFIDWQNTEIGARVVAEGAPSKTDNVWYIDENGKSVFNKEVYEKSQRGEIDVNATGRWSYWFVIPCTWTPEFHPNYLEGGPGADPYGQKHTEIIKPLLYYDLNMAKYLATEKGPVYQEKNTSVSNIWSNYVAKIIMETKNDQEVETLYNEMIAEMEKAGLVDIEKENYQIYKNVNGQ